LQPGQFGSSISKGLILSFSAGTGNGRLLLGVPREEIRSKEGAKARSGFAVIRAASPVGIREGNKLKITTRLNEKTMGYSVFQISKDAFHSSPVNISGIMHEMRTFVDCKGNIRTCYS